jgi:Restriction Enzyme Adenine Methylase Associated
VLTSGTTLINAQDGGDITATVLDDGRIETEHGTCDSPSDAATRVSAGSVNGWLFWSADTPEGLRTLASLREEYLAREN